MKRRRIEIKERKRRKWTSRIRLKRVGREGKTHTHTQKK